METGLSPLVEDMHIEGAEDARMDSLSLTILNPVTGMSVVLENFVQTDKVKQVVEAFAEQVCVPANSVFLLSPDDGQVLDEDSLLEDVASSSDATCLLSIRIPERIAAGMASADFDTWLRNCKRLEHITEFLEETEERMPTVLTLNLVGRVVLLLEEKLSSRIHPALREAALQALTKILKSMISLDAEDADVRRVLGYMALGVQHSLTARFFAERRQACELVPLFGDAVEPLFQPLLQCCRDADPTVQGAAYRALASLVQFDACEGALAVFNHATNLEVAIAALGQGLQLKHPACQYACEGLCFIPSTKVRAFVVQLQRLTTEPYDRTSQRAALRTLSAHGLA